MYENQNDGEKASFQLVFTPTFTRDLRRLNSQARQRVLRRLELLEVNPYTNCTKLTNVEVGVFRIRIGNWRVRYDVEGKQVILHRVRHRREVYRNRS